MNLDRAQQIADEILDRFRPHCMRVAIAGSVRRRKPDVGDIEIVCIPAVHREDDLFNGGRATRSTGFVGAVIRTGLVTKGDPVAGKYVQLYRTDEQLQIDVFTATPDNWGLILAIRTGSARFSHEVLACGWRRAGYYSQDGMLHRSGGWSVPVREESDLFSLLGIQWVKPEDRT